MFCSLPGRSARNYGLIALLIAFGTANAAPSMQDLALLRTTGEAWLARQAAQQYPGTEAEIQVVAPDKRLRFLACDEIQYSLPRGREVWNGGSLRARCDSPQVWSLFMPYRLRLTGSALVSKHTMIAHQHISAADTELRQVEYRSEPRNYLQDTALLQDSTLAVPLSAGTPIRLDMLRRPPLVKAGQRVRVTVDGSGYQISQDGIAQQQGAAGDVIRLKTPSGRMIHATVQPDGSALLQP